MTLTLAQWTLQQYHLMAEAGVLDGCAVELLKGAIVEMSPEGEPHAYYRTEFRDCLSVLLGDRALIREAAPITIPSLQSEPEPDIAVVQPLKREYLQHHPYPDNIYWVIEFSNSSLAKDLNEKLQIYATAEIPEYWVVDLKQQVLTVFQTPLAGTYRHQQEILGGEVIPVAFPDIAVPIAKLLS